MTLVCGTAGFDGTQFKGLLAEPIRHPAQQDLAQLGAAAVQHQQHPQRRRASDPRAGGDLPRDREAAARRRRGARRRRSTARVKSADARRARPAELQPLPRRLPRRCRATDAARATCAPPSSAPMTRRTANTCRSTAPEIDKRLKNGPELVSANFVIPYPPGFPIMVPGPGDDARRRSTSCASSM